MLALWLVLVGTVSRTASAQSTRVEARWRGGMRWYPGVIAKVCRMFGLSFFFFRGGVCVWGGGGGGGAAMCSFAVVTMHPQGHRISG